MQKGSISFNSREREYSMNRLIIFAVLVFGLFLFVSRAGAATIAAPTCAQSDVQTAINSASNGDTVVVPGGTCNWASGVTIPNTLGITLNGGGNTSITGSLQVSQNQSVTTRITGFNFSNLNCGSSSAGCIGITGSPNSAAFRFDHNNLTNTANSIIMMTIAGNAPGVIDHNTFVAGAASEVIHNLGMGAGNTNGWSDSLVPGGPNMLFVEDNTFTYNASGNPAYFWGTSAIQSYYGARTVFRHNTLNMMQVDQHGTCGNIYARWWEIYNNTFNTSVPNANQSSYIVLRGGSGVVFNNHHIGGNDAGSIEVTEDCNSGSYALSYQIGRGINQGASPAYIWGNDADMAVSNGNPTFLQVNRDYLVSASQPTSMSKVESSSDNPATTYSYTPYTYPHPLVSAVAGTPAPPTNVQAAVQ